MDKIVLSNEAILLKTFIVIDGKIYMGKHQMHAFLYDDILDKHSIKSDIPYYCYPRGALYKDLENNKEIYKLVGPMELNQNAQLKLAEAFKITASNYIYGYSEHYSEHQVREFAKNETGCYVDDVEDNLMKFKKQIEYLHNENL